MSATLTQSDDLDHRLTGLPMRVAAGLVVALAGSGGYLVIPMVIAALRQGAVPELWIGLIGSADLVGMLAGTALALLGAVRSRLRTAAIAAMLITLVANASSLAIHAPAALLMLRLMAGVAGGVAVAIGLAAVAGSRLPDRNFALFTLLQMLFAAIVAWLGDAGIGGLDIIYVSMFTLQLAGLAMALLLPARIAAETHKRPNVVRLDWRLAAYVLAANFLAAGGFLILWANIQAVTVARLCEHSAVAIINAGLAGGFAGALLALVVDGSRNRRRSAGALFAIGLTAILMIGTTSAPAVFLAGTFLLQLSTTAAFFGFGAVSQADPSGRLSILHLLAVKAGFGLAPLLASLIMIVGGPSWIIAAAFAATGVALLLYQRLIGLAELLSDPERRSA